MTACKPVVLALLALIGSAASQAGERTIVREWETTAGGSSERGGVMAGSAALRLFGEAKPWLRFFAEGSWAETSSDSSDVAGVAYPYDGRLRLGEAYAEASFISDRRTFSLRTGRFRTPFGMSAREDQAYSGFLRPPLVRYGRNYSLSSEWMELGAGVAWGSDRLQVEAFAGWPNEATHRRHGRLDAAVRFQGHAGPWVIGLNHLETAPDRSLRFARGDSRFTGLDLRWMAGGVLVKGEWIFGRAFEGTATRGAYLDLVVHCPAMGPVSAVARAEYLQYQAGAHSFERERFVIGSRVRLSQSFSCSVNLVAEPHPLSDGPRYALDLGVSLTGRR